MWIKPSDRLPEYGQEVLVNLGHQWSRGGVKSKKPRIRVATYTHPKNSTRWVIKGQDDPNHRHVRSWCPFPQPEKDSEQRSY